MTRVVHQFGQIEQACGVFTGVGLVVLVFEFLSNLVVHIGSNRFREFKPFGFLLSRQFEVDLQGRELIQNLIHAAGAVTGLGAVTCAAFSALSA